MKNKRTFSRSQYLQLIAMVRAHPFHEDKALSAQALW